MSSLALLPRGRRQIELSLRFLFGLKVAYILPFSTAAVEKSKASLLAFSFEPQLKFFEKLAFSMVRLRKEARSQAS